MIHVILACHNRRALTERALRSLVRSAAAAGAELDVTLFDDGSTDGTAEGACSALGPVPLTVIEGDGNAFWARGMATAESKVLEGAADEDLVLWLNDDVDLAEDAVGMMLRTLSGRDDRLAIGSTIDPVTGELNYGGYVRAGAHPLRFRHVPADGKVRPAVTLNGNCVLVPVRAARRIGGIDGSFSHGLADIDYGLRAHRAGVLPLVAPGPVGTCPSHDPAVRRPILQEWRSFTSVKEGGHPGSMIRILRRARPATWPVFLVWSYSAWWLRAVRDRSGRR